MKKEESKVIAQKLQNIPNGTLALKHCRAGGIGSTLFGEQFRAITAGKGCMEAYETFPGIEVSFNIFLASEVKFRHDASDSVLEIYYCHSGRVGWNMPGGTAVYLGAGDVTAHSMACCADSAMMFPLGYSAGLSISVDLKQLPSICPEVLRFRHDVSPRIFGGTFHFCGSETAPFHLPRSFKGGWCRGRPVTGAILLRKTIRNPVLFRFRAYLCPTLFCSCVCENFPLEIEDAGNADLFEQPEARAERIDSILLPAN